jgi:hypothetical protein
MATSQHPVGRRSLRQLALGAGPFLRRSDRVQVIARLVVVLSFLAAPLVAVAVSSTATAHLGARAAAEAAERSVVRAVLLDDAPDPDHRGGLDPGAAASLVPARVTWPGPGGTSRDDVVLVPPGTPEGTAVQVWVDADGHRTAAPLDPAGIPTVAAVWGASALVGLPLLTWLLYLVLRSRLDARRARGWEVGWAAVEPGWSSRLL